MKIFFGILRVFVGVLFIISGFIKLNDPIGFSIKLIEYFSEPVLNLPFLQSSALLMAVVLCIAEILLGFALILGYRKRGTLIILMGMILFFTFLTFYSAYFEVVQDCGCFGDALPLTPWQSFWKDVFLTIAILLLWFNREHIKPIGGDEVVASDRNIGPAWTRTDIPAWHAWLLLATLIASLYFAYHVLEHLPAIDFRAYKEGTNINDAMEPDPDRPAVYDYEWFFEKDGVETSYVTDGSYPKVDGTYKRYELKLVDPGYTPPITDLFIYDENQNDLRRELMAEPKLIFVVSYNVSKSASKGWLPIYAELPAWERAGYKVVGLSASGPDDISKINQAHDGSLTFYSVDETVLKAMIRSNPGVVLLHNGVIEQKVHYNDVNDLNL